MSKIMVASKDQIFSYCLKIFFVSFFALLSIESIVVDGALLAKVVLLDEVFVLKSFNELSIQQNNKT